MLNKILGIVNLIFGVVIMFISLKLPTGELQTMLYKANGKYYITVVLVISLVILTILNLFAASRNREHKKIISKYVILIMGSALHFILGIQGIVLPLIFAMCGMAILLESKNKN